MINTTPMLITKISEYINNADKLKVLHETYKDFQYREHFDFQTDQLNKFTLQRWLNLLRSLFSLQIILNKKIYLPGIWLFTIKPKKFSKEYNFPWTLLEMSEQWNKAWYTKKIIHDNMVNKILLGNKLYYERLDNGTFQIKREWEEKFSLYTNLETKVNYLNSNIKKFLDMPNLEVIHEELYNWWVEFKDIVNDYRSVKEYSFHHYLEDIVTDKMGYNMKILEDILVLIWYIENNKKEFNLD